MIRQQSRVCVCVYVVFPFSLLSFFSYHFFVSWHLSLFFDVRDSDCMHTVLDGWMEGLAIHTRLFLQMMKVDDSFFVTTFFHDSSVSLIVSYMLAHDALFGVMRRNVGLTYPIRLS
jgi:hypothetical protein